MQRPKDLGSVVLFTGEPGAWSYGRKGTANTCPTENMRKAVLHFVRADQTPTALQEYLYLEDNKNVFEIATISISCFCVLPSLN